ncbi:MAG TPA: GNAT family N-acetyltransferase [Thermomicrobiales bacterium]|nr:GNAT family N-acetyltransferase [Thermomicrobiales bacterium]
MPRQRPRVFVARAEQDVIGFVDLQPVPPDQRWHLTAIGTSPSAHHAAAMEALLRYGVMAAGGQGVKRLYARLRPESVVYEIARSLGFSPYAEEIVFAARPSSFRPAPTTTRPQEQSDTWAIHQLYNATVPREVQYAEAFTSHFWDVNARRAIAPAAVHGRVIEDGHRLAGYVRVASHAGTHVIELVASPDHHDVVGSLLDGALADIGRRHVKRVYCAVRTYQQHLWQPLEDRGFTAMWTQQLQVKYTTVTARAPATDPVLLHADVRERVPKRVPTFLQSHEQDESARPSR